MQSVKLIGVTQPVIDDASDANELIAFIARVSNPGNQSNMDTAGKLIKYLLKNKHWSPLEMCHMVIEIVTTRDIGRQILRHRSFSFQEFSQRYALATDFADPREARLQDKKNRQNSIEVDDKKLNSEWRAKQHEVIDNSNYAYAWAIENGIAKEVARSVLPEGLVNTVMYMSGSIRSWVHYCDLRMTAGTQKEHKEIALLCFNILCDSFPYIEEYFGGRKIAANEYGSPQEDVVFDCTSSRYFMRSD